MADETERGDDGGDGLTELRKRAADAVRVAWRLLDESGGRGPAEEELGPAIERLASLEAELAQNEEDFAPVFVHLGLLLGARCLNRRDSMSLESGERAEALRRLRWADRNGPLTDLFVVQARMMLLFLLAPWALPRTDGTPTALLDALLAAADERVLTETLRRDLTEAREVVDRIAEAPLDEEFHRQTANIRRDIDQMLAPGSSSSGSDSETAEVAETAETAETDEASAADEAPESALLDAVRGLVALAGSHSTPQFTRVLVCLVARLQPTPDGSLAEELRLDPEAVRLLHRATVGKGAGPGGVRRAADLALGALRGLAPDAPERARVARLHAYLLVAWEFLTPGPADFHDVERPTPEPEGNGGDGLEDWPIGITVEPGLIPHLDSRARDLVAHVGIRERRLAATFDRLLAYRTGDPGYLEDAAGLLREAIDASPAGSWWRLALQADLAEILEQATTFGGSFHDAEVSLATLRGLRTALERDGSVPADAPFALGLALSAADRELRHAQRTGDHQALPHLGEELRARYAALPPDSGWRQELAERLSRLDELSAHPRRPQETTESQAPEPQAPGSQAPGSQVPEVAALAPARAEPDVLVRAIAKFRRDLDDPQMYHEQEYDRRAALGLRLFLAVVRDAEAPELLDEAITELTRARVLLAEGRGRAHRVDVLTKLAEAHIVRAARGGPHADADRRDFVEVTREALGELAADVLLQIGADHGLSAALSGAVLARRLAFVAFRTNRPADAVADLERGRALVLQAAAASRGIPDLLDAAGHPELARQWRAQVPTDLLRPSTGDVPPRLPVGEAQPRPAEDAPPRPTEGAQPLPAGNPPIPSGLRRKALTVLGVRPGAQEDPAIRQLVGAADVAELTAGLAATGTDALVYLVPGMPLSDGSFPGRALILRPGAGPTTLALPELMAPGSPPLEHYLDAAAERSRALADPDADPSWRAACEGRWQDALSVLCEWAWRAVMEPLLASVRPVPADQWASARPPRIVLVPCGRLGVVPWHAARIRGPGEHGHRYACQEAVLSYAPSGAQFLAAAARRRMPPATGRQVLVADPELTLPWAEVETAALRAACYPGALRYGEFLTADEARDAAGTPAELLAVLPGGASPASVVHLSCHALAAPRPTDSALRLAGPPGAGRDAGRLTVAGILDGAAGRRPDAAGPLVVLSACETDLSTRHHDEALTLATALVTGGAADVVGSRWAVRDGPTSVMMAVFHHHVTAGGLAPPDALRAAQLWMLNPLRTPPPTLDNPLRHEATRPDLHHLHHWAAFTHQGNPAAASTG
ncbi:CHAT domain-containing protein [Streptomyces decoyicus]|uniref:CHAT domain-containing protein n=1 Tax=Streptomyces decoyicus TaxID=249567 RepID=UPI003870733A|nr:CHAT domain-containing protein [Streptomyces decoyicus]